MISIHSLNLSSSLNTCLPIGSDTYSPEQLYVRSPVLAVSVLTGSKSDWISSRQGMTGQLQQLCSSLETSIGLAG